jgi:hypothetical protein
MKITKIVYLASCCLIFNQQSKSQSLYDDFSGTSVNTSLWTVEDPFSDSSAIEGGGDLTINNRGGLLTQSGFSTPFEINGSFAFTGNVHDLFSFVIETTGSTLYPYGTYANGIRFNWAKESDTGVLENIVSIDQITGGNPADDVNLALGNYDFNFNQFYNFEITYDGTNIALYFGNMDTPLLTATDSTPQAGNQIGFYNREGAAAGSSISAGSQVQIQYISIQTVPEPSSVAMFGFGILSLIGSGKRKQRR